MKSDSHVHAGVTDVEDDVDRIAMLARKETRKASRAANKAGFFVEHAQGACVVKTPTRSDKIPITTTPIHANTHYVFASK